MIKTQRRCTCWLGTDSTFGSSADREACAVHGLHVCAPLKTMNEMEFAQIDRDPPTHILGVWAFHIRQLHRELDAQRAEVQRLTERACATCRWWAENTTMKGSGLGTGRCIRGVRVVHAYTPATFSCNQHEACLPDPPRPQEE